MRSAPSATPLPASARGSADRFPPLSSLPPLSHLLRSRLPRCFPLPVLPLSPPPETARPSDCGWRSPWKRKGFWVFVSCFLPRSLSTPRQRHPQYRKYPTKLYAALAQKLPLLPAFDLPISSLPLSPSAPGFLTLSLPARFSSSPAPFRPSAGSSPMPAGRLAHSE